MTDEREALLLDALRALEAIFNASYDGTPFTTAELAGEDFVLGILTRADYLGIRFADEPEEAPAVPRRPAIVPGDFAE